MMNMKNDIVLAVEDLSYGINDVQILKNISLKVKKGEFIGLIGPNGAGKTTLLKCINGINRAAGEISLGDNPLRVLNSKSIAKKIALMHQNVDINYPFPALNIVMMGRYPHLKRLQAESKEDYKVARESMEYTDTIKLENQPITEVSGGERQRVLFAKILAQETEIMLLDEPTASLDITHQEQIFRYSGELSYKGKTVIAAVHDLKIAARYCSRLILMKEGHIIADGCPEEVITSENLSKAYDVNSLVYRNRVSGELDFYLYRNEENKKRRKVHVIGGGGTASGVMRLLFENGFTVSSGVLFHGDSDLLCAETFGIESIVSKPFSEICGEIEAENIRKIGEADLTILCSMPFGPHNLANLTAAKHAAKLVIIEDEPPETRDFTGGKALEIYRGLRENAIVTTSSRLHEII